MVKFYPHIAFKLTDIEPNHKWAKVFKNGPSKICGRQLLKKFTWSILEYLDPNGHLRFFQSFQGSCFFYVLQYYNAETITM